MRKMILSCIDWAIQRLIDLRYMFSPNLSINCDSNNESEGNVYCRDFDPTYDSHLIDKIAENVPEVQGSNMDQNEFHAKFVPDERRCEDFYSKVEDPPIKDCDIKIEVKKKDYIEPPQDWHGIAKPEEDKWI